MTKLKNTNLTETEKDLLLEVLFSQQYALEIVGSEIADIESGRKDSDESRLRQINALFDRLRKRGM